MNFGEALQALKEGKQVQRIGWDGKGMFLYLVEGSLVEFDNLRGAAKDAAIKATIIENGVQGSSRLICPHIDMKAADGTLVIGWLASQTDMLADDWQILN